MSASLVMRDRETDSWWSIMSSSAIGGELEGAQLVELPLGEKTTWTDWVTRHPTTVVLSVGGRQHIESNPYESYFASGATYRDIAIDDRRLAAKDPVFAFFLDGEAFAAPYSAFAGGRVFSLDGGRVVYLTRPADAPLLLSSRGYLLSGSAATLEVDSESDPQIQGLEEAGTPLEGFDTFWYTWVAVNPDSKLLE